MRFRFVAVIVLMASACPALAQEPVKREGAKQDPAQLETVVVTAGRVAEKPTAVPQAMTVIPQEEIKKHQYQDLGGLLRNYGIQVDSYSPNQASSGITMRGMRSNLFGNDLQGGVLVLVDGRRAGTSNISLIPTVNVERVEIIRGPAAAQYGSSAIGGVVNIITKRGGATPSVAAEAGYGSWDTMRALGEGAWAYGPVDFSGGVSYLSANDYKTGDDKRYRNTGLDHNVGYSFNAGLNFLDEHRLGLVIQGVDGNDLGNSGDFRNITPEAYLNQYNRSLDLSYEGGRKDAGLGWKARYYHGNNYYRSSDPVWGNSKTQTEFQGAQGQVSFTKSFLTLTGGGDWQKYRTRLLADYNLETQASTYNVGAGFLLAKLAFWDDLLIVSGGLRYDKYYVEANDDKTDFNHSSPSLGLAVNPLKWLTLRANYGDSYQAPSAQQLLGFDGGAWSRYIGNPNLDPEQGRGWDAGFDIHHKSLKLGLTYFWTDYKDAIADRAVPGSFTDREYYNMDGKTKYRGLEAQASYDIGEFFEWPFMLRPYVNMTYLFKFHNDELDMDRPNVSNMNLTYGLQLNHPGIGLDVDLRATYFGHRKEQDYIMGSSTYGEIVRKGGETVVDLFATQTLYKWDGAGTLSLKGEIRNMFNVNYDAYMGYPLPGASYWLGLRYDY